MKHTMKLFALCAAVLAFSAALTSCQKEKATPEAPEVHVFHVELDATVADTKATYATASREITFESGDALYVALTQPTSAAWSAATGTLTYNGASFEGDITYTGEYSGSDIITDARDLTATFLPKDYNTVGYLSATGATTATKAFYAGAKDASVPQLVHLTASVSDKEGTAKSPLTLSAQNSVLCYSINANKLSAGAHTVSVSDGTTTISGSVTAVADAATTFAVAFPANATEKDYTLSISGYNNVVKSGKTLTAGHVVNITTDVTEDANAPLPGVFTVQASPSTVKVKFAKGNLQLTAANTWQFAANQWDYFGDSQSDNHRDLFGWGAANPNNTSTTNSEYTWSEWGENTNVVAALGSGWRTLTSAEWTYLLNTREGNCYCKATVNSKTGMVIFPDSYSHPTGVTAVASANTANAAFTTNTWSGEDWSKMETAGAVFLPAAGFRNGSLVKYVGSSGFYWSSTPNGSDFAYPLDFNASNVFLAGGSSRFLGRSVRLVQNQ
ncbi:MAG: hypothetical protein J6M31_01060 [Bacteroidales bacterium]|nr:hypothetical protein [Bacteroidales bacterium]